MKRITLLKAAFAGLFLMSAASSEAQLINLVEPSLLVNSPSAVAGVKSFTKSNDGSGGTSNWGRAIDSFWYNVQLVKPTGDSLGCVAPPVGSMTGKFAMIYRGSCQFSEKAYNAQQAGAIGIIIVNNVPGGAVGMAAGNNAASVTIPVLMISQADGNAINGQMYNGQDVYVSLTNWGFGFTHDLGFVNNSLSLFHASAIPKYELAAATNNNAYKGYTGSFIANFGSSTESNVKVKSVTSFTPTSGSSSILHQDSILISGTFAPSDSLLEAFATNSYDLPNITSTGVLNFNYTLTSSTADDQPLNNSASTSVVVTDTIYSKGRINEITGEPITTVGYRFNGAFTNTWGPLFYVREGGHKAISSQFTVSNGTSGTSETSLNGSVVNIYAFKWMDNNSDGFIQVGELVLQGAASKQFTTTDSNYNIFTANYQNIDNANEPLYLTSNSWYWFAAEVSNDLYLACDGEINYFNRSYAASKMSPALADYWAPQFQGSSIDLSGADPTSDIIHFPFRGVTANIIDSVSYSGAKGLVPAINVRTSTSKASVIPSVPASDVKVTMFPNPASNLLNVTVDNKSNGKVTARVLNGLGQLLFKGDFSNPKSGFTINTSNFSAGPHFLIIQGEDGKMIGKTFEIVK